jgi:hypothetical protein
MIMVDGWEAIDKSHIEGVLLKAGQETFLLTAVPPGSEHHGIAVATIWEEIVETHAKAHMQWLRYLCSDNAGQCARAQRILALQQPHIIWMFCWAHQVNLMVDHFMSKSTFAGVCNGAVKAENAIQGSSSKWYEWLHTIVDRLFGKDIVCTIHSLGETQWNTLQASSALQLQIQKACQTLVFESKDAARGDKLPAVLLEWGNDDFWEKLEEAELLICLLVDASFIMQRDSNTLADVLMMLVNIYKGYVRCFRVIGSS